MVEFCNDCGLEINREALCEMCRMLPDLVCHECMVDLFEGRTDPETKEQIENRRTAEERTLQSIFGEHDFRSGRRGSSERNVAFREARVGN